MRERVTTFLDVLGLLLVAFGIAALLYPFISLGSTIAAGLITLAGSHFAARGGEK